MCCQNSPFSSILCGQISDIRLIKHGLCQLTSFSKQVPSNDTTHMPMEPENEVLFCILQNVQPFVMNVNILRDPLLS